jgi:integrase
MPVHITRRRGGVWYARGTVRVGQAAIVVPEYSTGCRARADAEAQAAARDAEIRQGILEGPAGRARRRTIADCILAYRDRPGGVRSYDQDRLDDFNDRIGHRPLSEAREAWNDWLSTRGSAMSAVSAARWRTILQAALSHGGGEAAPRLPVMRAAADQERVVYLTDAERRRLLAAYNPSASCPILVLAYQGMRTQEVLQLDWRAVDFARRTLFIAGEQTKTRRGRTVPMHQRVDRLLFGLWHAADKPSRGPVFLSQRGKPYADTRGREGGRQGGNPLSQAHETACATAGVTGFRVHDWRHDWAARMVMGGCDLYTLMRLGGWSSLRMVQRYSSVTVEHMAEAIGRLA